jgi:hypothetical protein
MHVCGSSRSSSDGIQGQHVTAETRRPSAIEQQEYFAASSLSSAQTPASGPESREWPHRVNSAARTQGQPLHSGEPELDVRKQHCAFQVVTVRHLCQYLHGRAVAGSIYTWLSFSQVCR